jgi:Glycosyltransferase family 87
MLRQLFALDTDRLTPLEFTFLRAACLVTVFVAGWTFWDICAHPGDDLRNRVVGARVMLIGADPYTFAWQSGMPEELLDPVHYPHAHRLTVSPPTLLLYAPIAPLPWRTQRFISFLIEWLAMIGSLILLVRSLPEPRQRVVFLVGAVIFVIATDVWRLHLERGQFYVIQLLVLSAAVYWSRRGDVDSIPAGIALGLLALMRPNMLVIAPALLLTRSWRSTGAMLATVGVGVAATCLMLPSSSWQSYLGVGEQYYRDIQGDPIIAIPRPDHEGPVEGVEFAGARSLLNVRPSSFAALWSTLHASAGVPMLDLALVSKAALALIAATLIGLVWLRRGGNPRAAFALIVVLSMNTEFFLPHRWGYADVMLLAPLALLLPELLRPEATNRLALTIVLIGLVSGPLGQQFFDLGLATALRSWLVMGGLTLLVLDHRACDPEAQAKE